MPTPLFIMPQTWAEQEFAFTPTHGARAYDPRPVNLPAKDPEDVYLIYLSVRGLGLHRRQYRTKRSGSTADNVAKDLFNKAANNDNTYEVGKDLLGIIWKQPCHLYIVVHITNCQFSNTPNDPKHDPLHFHASKRIPGTSATLYFDKNAAFYEGTILPNNVLGIPAFRCINHLTDEDGDPLWHPRLRTYGFEIRYLTPGGLEIVDPDGQNQGPPA